MKETILNVVYDTETAQFLGTVESSCPSTDKRWYQADLYQTPSGYWFLAGEGGPETQFAVEHAGGRRTGSRGIIPLGRHKTMLWLIENDRIDILRKHFGHEADYLAGEFGIRLEDG